MNLLSRSWRFCLRMVGHDPASARGGAEVIVHDPAAAMPQDLDDPFHSAAVQEKIGQMIADAQAGERKPEQP